MKKSFKNSLGVVSSLLFLGICGQEAQALPSFTWSQAGAIPGLVCVRIHEDADPHAWGDNFLCSNEDLGLRWSQAGAIAGMRCTRIHEDADPHAWSDNFLCAPSNAPFTLSWSQAGAIPGKACTRIHEDADPHAWSDNFLCVESSTANRNFPLRKSQFTELGDHRRMESNAILSNTGRLDVTTRIWTRKQWSGFTGGVVIRFLDQSGNILGATGVHSWGVDGLRIPGMPSDRTSAWTDPVPPDLLNNTFGMEIVHTTNPKELKSQIDRAIDITCGSVRRVVGETKYCPKQ